MATIENSFIAETKNMCPFKLLYTVDSFFQIFIYFPLKSKSKSLVKSFLKTILMGLYFFFVSFSVPTPVTLEC